MRKSAYIKDSKKIFKDNLGRFISIVLIIMLGTAFFIGMNSISPLMQYTSEEYMKDYYIFDYELSSNLGYKKEDLERFKAIDNVEQIQGIYSYDALTSSGDKDIVVRLSSINDDIQMNKNCLEEGEDIKEDNECLISSRLQAMYGYEIGQTVKVYRKDNTDINDSLKITEFKIVGIAKNPSYLSKMYGNTTLSTGDVHSFLLVREEVFKMEDYTNVYIKSDIDKDLSRFSKDYKKENEKYLDKIDELNQAIAKEKFDKIYSENETKIKDAENKIKSVQKTVKEKYDQIRVAQMSVNKSIVDLSGVVASYYQTEGLYTKAYEKQQKIEELYSNLTKYETDKEKLDSSNDELNPKILGLKNELDSIENKIERNLYEIYALDDESVRFVNLSQENYRLYYEFNKKNSDYEDLLSQKEENDKKLNTINKSITDINSEIKKLQDELYTSFKGQEDLIIAIGSQELNINYKTINTYKEQIEKVIKEIENQKVDEKIENARKTVNEKKNELSLFKTVAKTTPLYENSGFKSLKDDLEKIAIMGRIFPVMFFVIAILVTITTITRMIEEDRKNIGTFKALGYDKSIIIRRYLIYALLAGLIGTVLGTLIGSFVIVDVLFVSYNTLYDLPVLITKVDGLCVFIALVISLISTVFSAWVVTKKALKENAAELMRPRLETTGKEIFMEKIPFIWNRFDFLFKICFRNIFRYKRRLFMTLIGIAGCTALIYAGLSLKSTLDDMSEKQFTEIRVASMEVYFKGEFDNKKALEVKDFVEKQNYIENAMPGRQQSLTVQVKDTSKDIFYVVMDGEKINDYFKLRNRRSGKDLVLDDSGVIITEKLANFLNVGVGEKVEIIDEDVKATVKIIGITENYLYNYLYFTPKMYERIYGKEVKFNELFVNTSKISEDEELELSNTLKKNEDIASTALSKSFEEDFKTNLSSLMVIVFLFIGCASLLSFTVLINLNNINIQERKRELSTIKLLGFYEKELESYVFRENIILTIIGTVLGFILGMGILGIIIEAAEVETIFLVKDINYINLGVAGIFTISFTLITNFIMKKKIKNIDMIDSLKSIE